MASARSRLHALLACAAAMHAALASPDSECSAGTAASELLALRIGLEWFLNPDHLPLVVALRQGYFKEARLEPSCTQRRRARAYESSTSIDAAARPRGHSLRAPCDIVFLLPRAQSSSP